MKKKPTPPRTEDPLEPFRQECRVMLDAALPKHNALSGLQRYWIKHYIENADGECRVESNGNYVTFHWCPVTKAVCKAIDQGNLSKDFNEHALLKWATETGYTLTWSGLNVWDNKKNEALDKAIKDCTQGLSGEETVFQWPPEIVEWVKAETGIEPELNDPAQKNRTDFETALQLLLRERTGYDLKDLEDGLPTSEYVQLARVAARIKGHREQTAAPPGKVETKTQDAARQTWVKQLKVKGAKWEDLCITVAPGGTVVVFLPTGQKIIETWAPGFLTRREGLLLNDFQLTATLEAKKNTVSILRAALIKASGISEDPFTCEDGLYTRLFSMGDQGGATGGESEERFNDGYQIRTARRR